MREIFKRNAAEYLKDWKENPNRKPLLIRGARQVGKTTLVQQFSRIYGQKIFLNLEKNAHRELFENNDDVREIIDILSLRYSLSDIKEKCTLLFIDEIQESTAAIKQLRYFYEELPELHVIAAGSLLEHAMRDFQNYPVGRISYLYLFPLNFQEYLKAIGKSQFLQVIKSIPTPEYLHSTILGEFNRYAIIGGMPEVIQNYIINGKIFSLSSIYESIWLTYKDDIEKYASNDTMREVLRYVIDNAPQMVDKRIKFQKFAGSNYRSREVGEAFRSLEKAKVILQIHPTTDIEVPILPDKKKRPRIQFLDTGIINYELNIQDRLLSMDDLSGSYKGAIIPHMIFQEILSLNTTSFKKPHFWVRDKSQSSAEVDMVLNIMEW